MSFRTPQLPLREALVEMLARVDRSPLALPVIVDHGKGTVDAMQAGIHFVWAAAKSFDSRDCRVVRRQGRPVLCPSPLARQVLLHLPAWLRLVRNLAHPVTQVHPALQVLVGTLMEVNFPEVASVEDLETMCRSNPNQMAMVLNWIVNTVRGRALKAMTQSIIHDFDHRCDEDYKLFKTYLNDVLKANPKSVIVQFELSMINGYQSEHDLDTTLRGLLKARTDWIFQLEEHYGKAIAGFAWRLQETIWCPVIHCVMLIDGPSLAERREFLKSCAEAWIQIAGPQAQFFDTCSRGSQFRYRGMDPELAEFYSKSERITRCATYLSKTQGLLRCEWKINVPFGGVGELDVEQHLRILEGQIAEIKRPRNIMADGLVISSTPQLTFRSEEPKHPIFGADICGR